MHALQNVEQLGCIEDSLVWVEQANQSNGIKELHAVDEFSEEVYVVLVFKGSDEFHDKRR